MAFTCRQVQYKIVINCGTTTKNNKLEKKMNRNKLGSAWGLMNTTAGPQNPHRHTHVSLDGFNSDSDLANAPSSYRLFDIWDFSEESRNCSIILKTLQTLTSRV
ncbi:hypothetical protein ATANTOWER_012980 [Ataeniobius toweri]|uniref:Uncharacterized protein n=1 Tax=Ataeniobius toweri TaxID=208326 RepID=A0ABU7AZF6_9TELE|nr:hypothetical protein [Ataeniobius toweri]